jgi:membrane protein YdbS with pleckstrin-like domain
MNPRAAQCRYPGQPEEEVTRQVFYKSIVMVLPILLAGVILSAVALFGMSYGAVNPEITLGGYLPAVSGSLLALISLLGLLFVGFLMFGAVWIWRNNRILVTNEHIVDIDQVTIFRRSVATLTLGRIQDVSAETAGPVQTLLQYGTITVQTAGQQEKFRFDYLPRPYEVEQYILEVHKEYLEEHHETDGVAQASETHDHSVVHTHSHTVDSAANPLEK